MSRHRSCLACPGSSEQMLGKLQGLPADEVVVDLEDAVAAGAKDEARKLVAEWLASADLGDRYLSVRVNAVGTPWFQRDVLALAELERRPDSIVVPKVEGPGDLASVEHLLAEAEAEAGVGDRSPLGIQALVETAAGLARVGEIAAAGGRLEALVIGYADLAASLGRAPDADPAIWDAARDSVLVAARANGLRAIDGPHLAIEAGEGLLASARRAEAAGFEGKWAIHPSQLETLNEVFTPPAAELEWARRVIAALDEAEAGGAGAVELDGQMLDEALRASALRVLSRAPGDGGEA
ncbi:MAG: CoA ester lyase [Solirubrobacterales bacterium]